MTRLRAPIRGWMIGWLTKEGEPHEVPLCDFKRLSEELQPGDVVLVEGRTRVGGIIKLITQTAWTHAALYIGRLHDIEDRTLRNLVVQHYQRDHSEQLLLEALIGEGTRISPLSRYANDHLRICRPHGLSRGDAQHVIGYAVRRLGSGYDVRQLLDLARFFLPWGIVPRRWRSSLLSQLSFKRQTALDSPSLGTFLATLRFRLAGSPPALHTVIANNADSNPTSPGSGMAKPGEAVSTEGS